MTLSKYNLTEEWQLVPYINGEINLQNQSESGRGVILVRPVEVEEAQIGTSGIQFEFRDIAMFAEDGVTLVYARGLEWGPWRWCNGKERRDKK